MLICTALGAALYTPSRPYPVAQDLERQRRFTTHGEQREFDDLQLSIDTEFGENHKVSLHLDLLIEAFRDAVQAFYEALESNRELRSVVFDRAGKCFVHMPTEYLSGAA